jgi:hypothetical protein
MDEFSAWVIREPLHRLLYSPELMSGRPSAEVPLEPGWLTTGLFTFREDNEGAIWLRSTSSSASSNSLRRHLLHLWLPHHPTKGTALCSGVSGITSREADRWIEGNTGEFSSDYDIMADMGKLVTLTSQEQALYLWISWYNISRHCSLPYFSLIGKHQSSDQAVQISKARWRKFVSYFFSYGRPKNK